MDTGWVSMRYMARQSEQDEVWYPLLTECGGDKPNWYIDFEGTSWSLGHQYGESAPYEMATFKAPMNREYGNTHVVASNSLSAVITKRPTNWNETDLDLGYHIDLIIRRSPSVFDGDPPNVIALSYLVGSCTITPNPWGRRLGD
jgi:hypothetical protein